MDARRESEATPMKNRTTVERKSERELVVTRTFNGPALAVPLDPCRLFVQPAQAELAGPHAPDLRRGDEPRLLQDADVLLHARQGHVELLGEVRNRSVCSPELLQNAASGGVGECGERGIEAGLVILNHTVQCAPRCAGSQAVRSHHLYSPSGPT